MNSMGKQQLKQGTDQAWPQAITFDLGMGGTGAAEVLWRCEGVLGGRVYTSGLFTTEAEAQHFAQQQQKDEPDQVFNVERIKASTVWN